MAERPVQTALRKRAYARTYESSAHQAQAVPRWLHHFNWCRPHASVGYRAPVSRLSLP
jgi:transposase InsO family protein